MTKECLWYNGWDSCYELLDFDPNNLTEKDIIDTAWKIIQNKYDFEENDYEDVIESLYLLNTDNLEEIK